MGRPAAVVTQRSRVPADRRQPAKSTPKYAEIARFFLEELEMQLRELTSLTVSTLDAPANKLARS